MKKNYNLTKLFVVALFVGFANTASAQYFTENFSNGFNGNWAFLNADGRTPAPGSAFATAMGANAWIVFDENGLVNAYNDTAAIANSWYSPAGASDDWMWTVNAIDLTTATAPRLNWTAYSNSSGFLEDYEVYVDTVNTNFGPATTLTPVFSIIDGENLTETARFADIPAFAGRNDVYIAFRQISNDDDILVIDNIVVAEAPAGPDMVTTATPNAYTIMPISQVSNVIGTANLANIGGNATGATVTVNVWDLSGPTNVHTQTTAAQNIAGSANANYTFTAFTPSTVGNYLVQFIPNINEVETNMSNDTASYIIQVSDSTYARDYANVSGVTGTLGIGAGPGQNARLGQMFNLINPDTLTSIDIFIGNGTNNLVGQPLKVNIYSFAGGVPTTLLKSTNVVTIDTTKNSVWTLTVQDGLVLPAGQFAVAVEENDSNITVGTTTKVFKTSSIFVKWDNGGGAWTAVEGFGAGFSKPFVIRPNFGVAPLTVGVNELSSTSFEVYPNPAVNNITVKNAVVGSTIEVYNNLGQLVLSDVVRSNNTNVDVANFDNGVYTIKNISNENIITQSFVKQ